MINPAEKYRVEDATKGNAESMAYLFQAYRPQLFISALHILGNKPMAQDALQDTFIAAFTGISSLRNKSSFYPWIKKILLNNCYLQLRKEKAAQNHLASLPKDACIEDSIKQQYENSASAQQMYSALNCLSAELRACVLLRYFSRFTSYEEIAQILGIPIGTVRSRLAAAREKLYSIYYRINESDIAFKEAKQWSDYYLTIWKDFYDDARVRNEFINLLQPDLNIRFTSGSFARGRTILETEFNNDLIYGSRFHVRDVNSSGNISILEGVNSNSPEFPDRCAPSSVVVLFRNGHKMVNTCYIFDSARSF